MASSGHPLGLFHWLEQFVSVLALLVLVVQFMFPVSVASALLLPGPAELSTSGRACPSLPEDLAFVSRMWVRLKPFHSLVQGSLLEESLLSVECW